MPDLRVTLLLLGALFIAGLALWELLRSRRARRRELGAGAALIERTVSPGTTAAPGHPEGAREPIVTLPEISVHDPEHELPLVDVIDESLTGLKADSHLGAALEDSSQSPAGSPATPEHSEQPGQSSEGIASTGAARQTRGPREPIVEWPDESVRQILALRVVATGERFAGRNVRQALAAEGFVLGRFEIYHRCAPDGRAIVSAANLTNPGTFDQDSIDMQRFGGLNLFAVLPGPLPPSGALEELLSSARNLCDRLQGALQDEQGEPLTPLRAAALREALEERTEHER